MAVSVFCRPSMNDPPTALVGFRETEPAGRFCRLSMNDPPTALVGFGKPRSDPRRQSILVSLVALVQKRGLI
jgi:hypothetical protein